MHTAALALISFIAGFSVTYLNIYNSEKFHTLFFLLYKSTPVLLFSFVYGVLGVGLFFLVKEDVFHIDVNKTIIATQYLSAFATGASIKAISEINLVNLKGGGSPLGIKTITQFLDGFFEQRLDSIGFVRKGNFLKPIQQKYQVLFPDAAELKKKVANDLKDHPDKNKVASFLAGIPFSKTVDTGEVLSMVLDEFGATVFKNIFPKTT